MKKYLQKLLWKYALRLTSAFNTPSLLKSRIVMLYQKPSARVAVAKFGFVLPTLMLCMLITAFTQRERVLPKALTTEVNKVAQRLATEMQNAFLPAETASKVVENKIINMAEEVVNLSEIEALPQKNIEFKQKNAPIFNNVAVDKPRYDSVKKPYPAKYTNNIIPFHFKGYDYASRFEIKSKKSVKWGYVSKKGTPYILMFYQKDNKVKLDIPVQITLLQEGQELPIKKTDKGYEFVSPNERVTSMEVRNLPEKMDLYMVLFERSRRPPVDESGFSIDTLSPQPTPHLELRNSQGEVINSFKRNKQNLNQKFELVFTKSQGFTDLMIEEVLVIVRNKDKAILSEKIIKGATLDLSDLKVSRGDIVQVRVTKSSGKLNGKFINNPTMLGGYRLFGGIFNLYPKIK